MFFCIVFNSTNHKISYNEKNYKTTKLQNYKTTELRSVEDFNCYQIDPNTYNFEINHSPVNCKSELNDALVELGSNEQLTKPISFEKITGFRQNAKRRLTALAAAGLATFTGIFGYNQQLAEARSPWATSRSTSTRSTSLFGRNLFGSSTRSTQRNNWIAPQRGQDRSRKEYNTGSYGSKEGQTSWGDKLLESQSQCIQTPSSRRLVGKSARCIRSKVYDSYARYDKVNSNYEKGQLAAQIAKDRNVDVDTALGLAEQLCSAAVKGPIGLVCNTPGDTYRAAKENFTVTQNNTQYLGNNLDIRRTCTDAFSKQSFRNPNYAGYNSETLNNPNSRTFECYGHQEDKFVSVEAIKSDACITTYNDQRATYHTQSPAGSDNRAGCYKSILKSAS